MSKKKLVLVENGEVIDKFALADGVNIEVVIGRASECDVCITNQAVSSNHVSILQEVNNELSIIDLNSTNGTFVNGARVESGIGIPIVKGDVITLGEGGDVQLFVDQAGVKNDIFQRKNTIIVGREPSCDIVLNDRSVSSRHCEIRKNGNQYIIKDLGSTNGTLVNGKLLSGDAIISESDKITVGGEIFRLGDYIGGHYTPRVNTKQLSPINILKNKETVIIGRDSTADIIIDDNVVSRKHARITIENGDYYIEDLRSTNGTFVNGEQVRRKTKLSEKDEIRIGLSIINLSQGESDTSSMVAIKAVGVSKKYSNGYIGLQPMSIEIPTKSFVALMGPSGCGKTTLLNILNGANPSTTGSVSVHGLDLKQYYSLIKQKIGYVPQDDIVHKDLSVDDSLYYAAKLRMNEDTTDEEINRRINQVLDSLNINDNEIRKNQIKELSGGQRKRISIAVELLNRPSILFLDEPTSPLDPETIEEFLGVLKNLTITEGTTIVMVTHKPEDLNYVDKVLFLANKGHIAFYGDVRNVYSYFNVGEKSINKIYALMSDGKEAEKWYAKWMNHSKRTTAMPYSESKEAKQYSYSSLRQYYWLTRRYLHIKLNDKLNLILLFAQPIIIAILLALIFDKFEVGVIFLMTISAIWFGVSNSAKEIVDEVPIYTRERMFNLKIIPYLFSKISVLSVIALIQVTLFVLIVSIRYASDDISISNEIH
jgi:ABC-type multidrug transport system ATPase subunit